ncbi:MAG: tetratricopeptide repeat protein [Myxococcales bacterium]|nr:tetratricopeptide repeat protein [Myxococcales bacterium]
MTTLRRLLVSAALAASPALPVAATSVVAVTGCGGKSTKKVAKPDPKPPAPSADEVLAKARAAAKAGDVDTADAKYKEAEKLDLALATVKEHVALLAAHGRATDAVAIARAYYEAKPADSNGSLVYANALIGAEDFFPAIEVAGEVVDLETENPAGFETRGRALIGAGKLDEGVEDLRKARDLAPKQLTYVLSYGIGLEKANKIDEAALAIRAAVDLDDNDPRALMHMGVVRRLQFEAKEAVGWLVRATKADPSYAEAWFNLAIAQNEMGDDFEAEASAEKATALAPRISSYWYVYGEMLRINKKPQDAKNAYGKAIEATPPHPKAAAKYAFMLYEAGEYPEAEVFLTDSLSKDPQNSSLYYNLGWVYSAQKKYRLGVEAFERYLELAAKDDRDRPKAAAEIKALKKKAGMR